MPNQQGHQNEGRALYDRRPTISAPAIRRKFSLGPKPAGRSAASSRPRTARPPRCTTSRSTTRSCITTNGLTSSTTWSPARVRCFSMARRSGFTRGSSSMLARRQAQSPGKPHRPDHLHPTRRARRHSRVGITTALNVSPHNETLASYNQGRGAECEVKGSAPAVPMLVARRTRAAVQKALWKER